MWTPNLFALSDSKSVEWEGIAVFAVAVAFCSSSNQGRRCGQEEDRRGGELKTLCGWSVTSSLVKAFSITAPENNLDWEFLHVCSPRTDSEPLPFGAICPMMDLGRARAVLGCGNPNNT
jgi:hypothetical protein